jgi:hypothetical protein
VRFVIILKCCSVPALEELKLQFQTRLWCALLIIHHYLAIHYADVVYPSRQLHLVPILR